MLVLTLRPQQGAIVIETPSGAVRVSVGSIEGQQVHIGIKAPRAWNIYRTTTALPASTSVGVVDAIHEEGGDAIVSNRPGPQATDAGARAGANT